MGSELIEFTVAELITEGMLEKPLDGNHGGTHPKGEDFIDSGIPFIMASDMSNGLIDTKGCKYISKKQADALRKGFSITGDILLSHKATIGRTAIVGELSTDYVMLTPQVTYYRVKDKTKLNNKYLKYYFDSREFQGLLNQWAGGGSTRAYLGITGQLKLPIKLPDIELQKAIAYILSSLDDKIELNRQMNETLESMAQALFKSWFVDFDPVIDNALAAGNPIPDVFAERAEQRKQLSSEKGSLKSATNPHQSHFPREFEYTEEMGWIPKGWNSVELGDFAFFGNGKKSPSRAVGKIPIFGSNGQIGVCDQSNRDNTIVIGRVGSYCGSLQYYPSKCWITDNAMSANMKNKEDNIFLFQLLSRDNLNDRKSGSGQPLINQSILRSIKTIIPTPLLIKKYSAISNSFYRSRDKSNKNCVTLESIRDTLLPKLLSGKLHIPDAEKLIEDIQ